jgi:hypothetical protein
MDALFPHMLPYLGYGSDESAKWQADFLQAIGSRWGTPSQRQLLARDLPGLVLFMVGYEKWREEMGHDLPKWSQFLSRRREALEAFRSEYGQSLDVQTRRHFDAISVCFTSQEDDATLNPAAFPEVRRGRQNATEVGVAKLIARVYHSQLGRWPSGGRRAASRRTTPYHRLCDVAERLLQSIGVTRPHKGKDCPLRISDSARARGIVLARIQEREAAALKVKMEDPFYMELM